ncbi:MAG: FtsX-like permease family protein, partial [Pseudomonadota bacterium]
MRRGFWVLRALLSHWRRRPAPLAAMLAGLAIATALWSGVQAINAEARASYARSTALIGGGDVATLAPRIGVAAPDALFAALRRAGAPVSPVLEGRIRVGETRLRVLGIEPLSFPGSAPPGLTPGEGDDAAAFLAPPWRALASAETLRRIGLDPDGDLSRPPPTATGVALPPLQRSDAAAPGVLVVDIGAAQALLGRPGEVSRFLLPAAADLGGVDLDALGLARLAPRNDGDPGRLTASFHLNLSAFGLLAFLVGLLIVHAAIGLAIEQRLPLFRTLRATGVGAGELTRLLALELCAFALLAGAAGAALGYALAGALLPDVALSLRGLFGVDAAGEASLRPEWWAASLAMSVGGALLAGASSLWRVGRMPPLESAAPQAWRAAHRRTLGAQSAAAAALA